MIFKENKRKAVCIALVSLSLASSGVTVAQPNGPAGSPPPPPPRTTNPDAPPRSDSGSGGASIGVQIDVGQVIGGLAKLRKEREARRKEREATAAALAQPTAEAAAPAARDKAPAITNPVAPPVIAVETAPTEARPVKAAADQIRPVVMFTPSMPAKPEVAATVSPKSVVNVQRRVVRPPILSANKPIVAPKSAVVATLPSQLKAPPKIAQVAKAPVAVAPIVPETVVLPLEIQTPLPLPVPTNPLIETLPSAIQAPVLAKPTIQVAAPIAPEKPAPPWPLWAAIGLGILAVGALIRRLLGPKSSEQSAQNEIDQPDRTITGYGFADSEPQSTLTFNDDKGLLPAILTSPGETNSVLVFETDAAST